jgi:hypothetical protein
MLKVVGLAVAFASMLAATTAALADSKSAAEFALKTCLLAMDDLSNV